MIDLVVTSPPFLDTVDYRQDNWLRMWFCEVEEPGAGIWQIKSLAEWVDRMKAVFLELRRVLRPGGKIAFEVGEVRKGKVRLENEILLAGREAGLVAECVMIHSQAFTKTSNCWGVSNNRQGTNSNRIVVFSKPA